MKTKDNYLTDYPNFGENRGPPGSGHRSRHHLPWSHLINFAGTAFPLRTNDEMAAIMDYLRRGRAGDGEEDVSLVENVNWVETYKAISERVTKKDQPPLGIQLIKVQFASLN